MSKSSWLIAITSGFVLASLLAGVFAIRTLEKRYASDRENIAYQYDSGDKRVMYECFRMRGITSITDCVVETIAAKQEPATSYQDLKAQQHMSLSALGVLIVSSITMLVTAVGVIFVWRTLIATQETATVTRVIGERQTRPYVMASGIKSEIIEDCYVGRIRFTNAGATPAVVVSFGFRHYIGEHPDRETVFSKLDVKACPTVIGPSQKPEIGQVTANLKATIDLRKGTPIFIVGLIVYREPGGVELLYTEFGYKVFVTHETKAAGVENSMQVSLVANEIPSFCTIDQDCFHYKVN